MVDCSRTKLEIIIVNVLDFFVLRDLKFSHCGGRLLLKVK